MARESQVASEVTHQRWVPLAAAGALALTAIGAEIAAQSGWRVNLTASAPLGLYRLRGAPAGVIPRGVIVEACPPSWVTPSAFPFYMAGDCRGGRAMLKTVAGIPGDTVVVSDTGVTINGVGLPGSAPAARSLRNPSILLPRLRGALVLGSGQYWLYGAGAHPELANFSFDSRYFGPIERSDIRAIADSSR